MFSLGYRKSHSNQNVDVDDDDDLSLDSDSSPSNAQNWVSAQQRMQTRPGSQQSDQLVNQVSQVQNPSALVFPLAANAAQSQSAVNQQLPASDQTNSMLSSSSGSSGYAAQAAGIGQSRQFEPAVREPAGLHFEEVFQLNSQGSRPAQSHSAGPGFGAASNPQGDRKSVV